MSRPPITVVAVESSKASTASDYLLVTIKDSAGLKRDLNLSPQAQRALLLALTTTTPFGSTGAVQGPNKFLVATNIRASEMPDKTICLEVFLSHQSAVHILLPGLLAEGTVQALQQMLPTGQSKH